MATMVTCVLSFMVWLHHFFTMGAGADVNGFFGVMTMIIAVPTGVKIFNWLFTLYEWVAVPHGCPHLCVGVRNAYHFVLALHDSLRRQHRPGDSTAFQSRLYVLG